MNLFELFVKIGAKDEASGTISKITSGLGKGLATAAKIGTAAVGAAATGIAALTTAAVNNYAEYEQLVGGVETLFKTSSDKVMEYAENAYKTAGLSANEYMETVTSFSASLLQSLDGDTAAAAEKADLAITDMADNANKMGTSMESIQNAYQGFAKQNYTMLDNLKLGYGGTKEEMQRLIADAAELSDTVDAQSMSFDNIVEAIHVVQTEMGITGTTAKEAASTIQGSVGMMKSSWTNLVTGISDENANLDVLITNFVDSVGTVAQNIVPKIGVALNSASKLISDLIPVIVQEIPVLIEENLPILAEAAISIIKSLVDGISQNQEMLMTTAFETIKYLATSLITMLPDIIQVGVDLIFSLIDGITGMLGDPVFVQSIIDVILKIVDILTNPDTITRLLNAAVTIIVALAKGLIQALPQLLAKVPEIISNLVKAFGQFLQPVIDIGKNIIDGIKKGISNAWNNLISWFKGLFGDLIGIAKKILGIASPSKVFKKIGRFTAEGFGAGFEDEFAHVKDDMEDALNFEDASVGINASIRKVGAGAAGTAYGGTSIGNITINIDGAKYSDEQSLAYAIALEIQNMTDRREAVYA